MADCMKNFNALLVTPMLFTSLMEVFSCMPVHTLVGFTSDGAAVMISPKEGVLVKLRSNVNSKIFATHCPPHRSVLACKRRSPAK